MHNLGVAYYKGAGGVAVDLEAAQAWFLAAGAADDLWLASTLAAKLGRHQESFLLLQRSAKAGEPRAQQRLRELQRHRPAEL